MGVSLKVVQDQFANIIVQLCSEPVVLSKFAIWLDLRLAEYKSKGAISLAYSDDNPDPSWLRGLEREKTLTDNRVTETNDRMPPFHCDLVEIPEQSNTRNNLPEPTEQQENVPIIKQETDDENYVHNLEYNPKEQFVARNGKRNFKDRDQSDCIVPEKLFKSSEVRESLQAEPVVVNESLTSVLAKGDISYNKRDLDDQSPTISTLSDSQIPQHASECLVHQPLGNDSSLEETSDQNQTTERSIVKRRTIEFSTFLRWDKELTEAFEIEHQYERATGKTYVVHVHCKVCSRNAEAITSHSSCKGKARRDMMSYILGSNYISKGNLMRHLKGHTHARACRAEGQSSLMYPGTSHLSNDSDQISSTEHSQTPNKSDTFTPGLDDIKEENEHWIS